jgi:hypothetical protein
VPPAPYPVPQPPPKTSPLPLLALLFGVLGLPTGFPPLGLAGVILGAISLYKIRRGMPGSRAMALVGLICGSISVVLVAAFIVLVVVVPD